MVWGLVVQILFAIFTVIFVVVEYMADLREKIRFKFGAYGLGFCDCLVIVVGALLVSVVLYYMATHPMI